MRKTPIKNKTIFQYHLQFALIIVAFIFLLKRFIDPILWLIDGL